jgi:hypothetical protein
MNLPELKTWCDGMSLYKVKTNAGFGEQKYVIATDFNDAAEKALKFYEPKKKEGELEVADQGHVMGISGVKYPDIIVKEIEVLSDNIII